MECVNIDALKTSHTTSFATHAYAYANPFWGSAKEQKFSMYQVGSRSSFVAELTLDVESMGTSKISGVLLASDGTIAPRGTFIVDTTDWATQLIGIADGLGGLIAEEAPGFQEEAEEVRAGIINKEYRKEL